MGFQGTVTLILQKYSKRKSTYEKAFCRGILLDLLTQITSTELNQQPQECLLQGSLQSINVIIMNICLKN